MGQRIAEPDGGGGLAFAGRRGRDGGDEDQLAVGEIGERSDVVERDVPLVVAVRQDEFRRNVELLRRHLDDRPHFGGLRDFDVGFWLLVLIGCARAWFLGTFTRLNCHKSTIPSVYGTTSCNLNRQTNSFACLLATVCAR